MSMVLVAEELEKQITGLVVIMQMLQDLQQFHQDLILFQVRFGLQI